MKNTEKTSISFYWRSKALIMSFVAISVSILRECFLKWSSIWVSDYILTHFICFFSSRSLSECVIQIYTPNLNNLIFSHLFKPAFPIHLSSPREREREWEGSTCEAKSIARLKLGKTEFISVPFCEEKCRRSSVSRYTGNIFSNIISLIYFEVWKITVQSASFILAKSFSRHITRLIT